MKNKVGSLIKNAREKMGISQRELAKRMNISNSTISRIENGEVKKPDLDIAFKISEELNINIYTLLKASNFSDQEIMFILDKEPKIENKIIIDQFDKKFLKEITTKKRLNIENLNLNIDEETRKIIENHNKDKFYIDIIKVLNEYKKGLISEEQVIKLFLICRTIKFTDFENLQKTIIYPAEEKNIKIDIKYKSF